MQRRKFLLGAGSLAASGAAILGTGAVSSVQAERNIDVEVVSDESAYLQLIPESPYATTNIDAGALSLNFNEGYEDPPNGGGLNARATTEFNNVFSIRNEGTKDLLVWLNFDELHEFVFLGEPVSAFTGEGEKPASMSGPQAPEIPDNSGAILEPGNSVGIAMIFRDISLAELSDGPEGASFLVNAAADDSQVFNGGPSDAGPDVPTNPRA